MFSLSLFHMDPLIENTLILIMCMPVASNSSVYAFMYGEDATLASKAIFLTSVSCGNDFNCVYFAQFVNNVTNVTINKGQSLSY